MNEESDKDIGEERLRYNQLWYKLRASRDEIEAGIFGSTAIDRVIDKAVGKFGIHAGFTGGEVGTYGELHTGHCDNATVVVYQSCGVSKDQDPFIYIGFVSSGSLDKVVSRFTLAFPTLELSETDMLEAFYDKEILRVIKCSKNNES